jgi:hypothetical protein
MKKTLAILIGLALAGAALTVSAQQAPGRGRGPGGPANQPGVARPNAGPWKNCPFNGYCPGQGLGQQHRYGWGQGQGQGGGKGFRGGPRDGTGPRRDGTGRDCPNKL